MPSYAEGCFETILGKIPEIVPKQNLLGETRAAQLACQALHFSNATRKQFGNESLVGFIGFGRFPDSVVNPLSVVPRKRLIPISALFRQFLRHECTFPF
jgi:hypothetical protein